MRLRSRHPNGQAVWKLWSTRTSYEPMFEGSKIKLRSATTHAATVWTIHKLAGSEGSTRSIPETGASITPKYLSKLGREENTRNKVKRIKENLYIIVRK